MLEGLEISEVLFSNIDLGDRSDAEFFSKENLQIEKRLKYHNHKEFRNIGQFVASAFYPAATQLYEIGDTPFIRCLDCIKYPLISKEQNNLFEKIPIDFAYNNSGVNLINKGDLVITKVGTPCYASIIMEHDIVALSRTVLGVKNIIGINRFYLLVFLRSKYGFAQLQRQRELTIQYQLTLERVKKILIFIPTVNFQIRIESLMTNFIEQLNWSKQIYSQAETLLLETLGLNNFEATTEAVNIKSFKESFLSSGRLDAEYYQKKYEEIIARVKLHKYDQLGNLVYIKKSIEPGSDAYQEEGVPFIRVSNLNKMGLSEPDIHLDGVKYKDVVRPRKDTILLSKDGSVGIAYKVSEDMNAITSGAILHLSVKTDEVLPDYLTLVLNSKVVQMQAERDAGGSILQHWKPSEIEQVEIPIIDKQIQEKIASLISESFMLKKQSEQLLETAKRAVEIAIEDNEEAALQYIQQFN